MLKEGSGVEAAVLDACLHHHEKMDGTGYPDRLQGTTRSQHHRPHDGHL
jgi:HD-GYP domain-containing protein (c-di-GMP phosphodiesterase class II)